MKTSYFFETNEASYILTGLKKVGMGGWEVFKMSLQDFKPKSSAIQLPCKVQTVNFTVNVQDHVLRCRYAAEASFLTSKSEYI